MKENCEHNFCSDSIYKCRLCYNTETLYEEIKCFDCYRIFNKSEHKDKSFVGLVCPECLLKYKEN